MQHQPGETLGGYRIERKEPLHHLAGAYYELRHVKTGARHIHIACPEDNHTFGVLFPTVPEDSSGVAHILEHVVLAGSKRFPVRDPFFSMIPRSLKTFMNAMTASDWTMYPFSTRNEKDFFNLLSIYLDAAFFPLISEEAFKQEGHRFEFEVPEDSKSGLRYKGVVFNEMKGAMATPQSVMEQGIGSSLFPDLTYANNSGGDPEHIPQLTWQQLKEFHAVHYHPSNAYFFTYGNLQLDRLLREIESQALSHFDKLEVDVAIPDARPFAKATSVELTYPLSPSEESAKKSQVLVAWVANRVTDSFETLTLRVLTEVLLGNPAAPLYRALMGSGIGDALADGTGYHTEFRQAVLGAGLQGISAEDAEQVEKLIFETLASLAEGGLGKADIEAAIHQLEFEAREVSNRGFPYSLKLFFELAGAYIYGGDPYLSLQFEQDLARLRQSLESGPYLEDCLRRWFLDNKHRALIILRPDQELEARKTAEELAKLAEIEAGLSDQQLKEIVQQALRLKELQEAKQDLSSLPTLELADVPMRFEAVPEQIEDIAGAVTGLFPQPTNGIVYVDIRADFSDLPDRLVDLLPLFSFALPKMGAAADDYQAMARRISQYTGGIQSAAGVRPQAGSEDVLSNWTISGKALVRNLAEFMAILRDFLTAVQFDPKRLQELIGEMRAHMQAQVVSSGTQFAMYLASAKLSVAGALDERLHGLSQLKVLKRLSQASADELDQVIADLTAISVHLFRNRGLRVCVTAEQKCFDDIRALLETTLGALPPGGAGSAIVPVEPAGGAKSEARTTSVPVAFNVKLFKTVGISHADAPALMALGHFMRATFLHREIREKGGAYGAGASFDAEKGQFSFTSFRDPNIAKTYKAFDQAVRFVTAGGLDPDEVKEAVLSACGAVDPLESPDTKGRRRFFDDLAGYSLELRQRFKKGLLQLDAEDLIRVTNKYLVSGDPIMATVCNADMVAEANRAMGEVFEVAPAG
ncbi:MAG: insulinase family protein [Actinomycetota bacterium]